MPDATGSTQPLTSGKGGSVYGGNGAPDSALWNFTHYQQEDTSADKAAIIDREAVLDDCSNLLTAAINELNSAVPGASWQPYNGEIPLPSRAMRNQIKEHVLPNLQSGIRSEAGGWVMSTSDGNEMLVRFVNGNNYNDGDLANGILPSFEYRNVDQSFHPGATIESLYRQGFTDYPYYYHTHPFITEGDKRTIPFPSETDIRNRENSFGIVFGAQCGKVWIYNNSHFYYMDMNDFFNRP